MERMFSRVRLNSIIKRVREARLLHLHDTFHWFTCWGLLLTDSDRFPLQLISLFFYFYYMKKVLCVSCSLLRYFFLFCPLKSNFPLVAFCFSAKKWDGLVSFKLLLILLNFLFNNCLAISIQVFLHTYKSMNASRRAWVHENTISWFNKSSFLSLRAMNDT